LRGHFRGQQYILRSRRTDSRCRGSRICSKRLFRHQCLMLEVARKMFRQ
jgi:hypothetical protein